MSNKEKSYKVVLSNVNGVPSHICVGEYSFNIKDGKVFDNKDARVGSEMSRSLKYYESCFELAQFAFETGEFDDVKNE